MKKYRFSCLLLTLLLLPSLLASPALALEAPEITAGAALLMDARHDEVLYEKNASEKMYPASITKVMTALLVLEAVDAGRLSMDQIITASSTYKTGLSANGSTQDIQPGEQMTLTDLMYCLLVASANEAANILAEEVDGSVGAFVDHMNRRAQELGCRSTQFTNPHGLHDDDHYTTAHDVYLFCREAMEHEEFCTIVSAQRYTVPATNMHSERLFYNSNALLVTWFYTESYIYDKCIGGKTGTTDEGGYCLFSAAKSGDDYLICVVLKAERVKNEDGSWDRRQFSESRRLFRWGFSNFERMEIVDLDTPLAQVAVTLSENDHVLVRPGRQLERTLPSDLKLSDIQQEIRLNVESVQAPVEAGQVLGSLTLRYQGRELGTVELVAVDNVERSEILYNLDRAQTFLRESGAKLAAGAAILVAGVILLRLTLLRRRSPYGSKNRGRRPRNYNGR